MSLTITLRKSLSEANRVTKSFVSGADIALTGTFRDEQDLLNPVIKVETSTDLSSYDYVEIPAFGRKYFMSPSVQLNNVWILTCKVDVLSTYDAGIRGSEALVKRTGKQEKMNFYINDGVLYTEQREIVTYENFKKINPTTGERKDATFGTPSYYLIVAGG